MPVRAQVKMGNIPAHPALWTVHAKSATLYLLGSIHILPANVVWRTHEIERAMANADVFVFEAPLDAEGRAEVTDFIARNGTLPKGETLRGLLPKPVLADYERALTAAQLPATALDDRRPWLAELALDVAYLQRLHYVVADGVDQQVYGYALAHGKTVRTLETPAQQFSLFMPKNRKLEIAEFDADLKELRTEQETIGAMIDAWGAGDAKTVAHLMNKDLESVPGAKKILIDDRNRAWAVKLAAMLATPGVYFVTVGTGHLVGLGGVPALLRAKGFAVDGP